MRVEEYDNAAASGREAGKSGAYEALAFRCANHLHFGAPVMRYVIIQRLLQVIYTNKRREM